MENKIRVWDLPTRLFHWALVVSVGLSIGTGLAGDPSLMDIHMRSGVVTIALVSFRLLWGFIGSPRSRFSDFVPGFAALRAYLRGGAATTPGHAPPGGLSVLAFLAILSFQAGTGLFANDDIFNEGPLAARVSKEISDTLTGYHYLSSRVLFALIALHLLSILFYALVLKQNLLPPMIHGRKPADGRWADVPFAPASRAVIAAFLAAAVAWAIVSL